MRVFSCYVELKIVLHGWFCEVNTVLLTYKDSAGKLTDHLGYIEMAAFKRIMHKQLCYYIRRMLQRSVSEAESSQVHCLDFIVPAPLFVSPISSLLLYFYSCYSLLPFLFTILGHLLEVRYGCCTKPVLGSFISSPLTDGWDRADYLFRLYEYQA